MADLSFNDTRNEDDIVRDSIIKNKERTKSYWEQLMLTAAAESNNKSYSKPRDGDSTTPTSSIHSNSNRNSVCSIEETGISEEMKEVETELRNVKEEKRRIEREIRLRAEAKGQDGYHQRMEEKIAMELEEMRQREEELRKVRETLVNMEKTDDEIIKKDELDGVTQLEDVNSQDGSNYSEYGSEEKEPSLDGSTRDTAPIELLHLRSQSLESVSSGHSSGSGVTLEREKDFPKRRQQVTVRPFEDPEEDEAPSFKRLEKETPIEREIRIAREREDQLRKDKGIVQQEPKTDGQITKKTAMGRKDALENDTRGVQHRLATNRIQQEIEENSEKEIQLRTEGKILTTSQETVDSKVTRFTQLAEHAIQEGQNKGRKMKRSSSTLNLPTSDGNDIGINFNRQTSQENQRNFSTSNNSQRGIMQRFIASKGRLSAPNTKYLTMGHTPRAPSNAPVTMPVAIVAVPDPEPPAPPVVPSRNGFRSAEEKIQDELREMRMREEELRLQRAHSLNSMARSQPNLLSINDEPEEEMHSWRSHEARDILQHASSNPNLLDTTAEAPKIGAKGYRKRFSLLEQWENRIQSLDV